MNIIDTRDLAEEMQELTDRQESEDTEDALDEDESERLEILTALFAELEDTAATYGATLIPEYDFTEYAEELAEELGLIPENASWPATYIDWEAAADALSQDYSTITFDGTDYYYQLH